MTEPRAASPAPPRRRRLRRVLFGLVGLAVLAAIAALVFLPVLARPGLERLLGATLHTPVSIGELTWEPIAGRVTAREVSLGEAADRTTLARLFIEGSPRALWRGEVVVDRLEIDAPVGALQLDARYRPLLPGFGDAAQPTGPALPPISVRQLTIRDGELSVRYPVQQQLRAAQLHITRLDSSNISVTAGAVEMQTQLAGTLDGAALEAQARLHLAGDDTLIEASGSATGLDVNRRIIDLLPELDTFHATVDLRGTYTSTTAPARHTLHLDVTLHEPRITDDAGTEFAALTVALPDVLVDLAHGAIAIDHVAIDEPSGALQLDAHYRPTLAGFGSSTSTAAAPSAGSQPTVSVRELLITDGALTLRYPVQGQMRAVPLHIARLACSDIEAAAGALRLTAQLSGTLDGAALEAEAHLQLGGAAPAVSASGSIKALAIDRARLDLPAGFESLRATLDARAAYESQSSPPRQTLGLDVRITAPHLDGASQTELGAKAVALPVIAIDLLQRRIDLGAVSIEAPALTVALTDAGVVSPLPIASGNAGAAIWTLQSGAIDLRNGRIRIQRGSAPPLAMAIATARWGGITPGKPQPLSLRASLDGGGTIAVDGGLGIEPLDATLDVQTSALPLPALTQAVPGLPLRLARGSGDATLHITQREGQLRIRGQVRAQDVHTAPPNAQRPAEVLAVNLVEADFAFDSTATPALDIASLKLSYPYVMVQRRRDGLFPYDLLDTSAAARDGHVAPPAAPAWRIRQLEVDSGKLEFVDNTLTPAFWTSVSHVDAQTKDLALPATTTGTFHLSGKRDEISPLEVDGTLSANGVTARAALRDALLESLNPYVAPLLGYAVTAGWLSLDVDAAPSAARYDATARLVLSGVDVSQTGVDTIQQQSGVPLPIALSLIANPSGTIEMTLPLALDTKSGRFTLGSVVGQALRSAIVGALTSPLRILGNLFGIRGAPHAFAIDPIPFVAGAGGLDAAGSARIAEIARLLQAHPGLLLIASPQITTADLAALGNTTFASPAARTLAEARTAAIRTAFTTGDSDAPLAPERLMLVAWQPPAGTASDGTPGVYVELQDQP